MTKSKKDMEKEKAGEMERKRETGTTERGERGEMEGALKQNEGEVEREEDTKRKEGKAERVRKIGRGNKGWGDGGSIETERRGIREGGGHEEKRRKGRESEKNREREQRVGRRREH